jgi:glycine/D-amino acid oxidase-like deaminating enzyme/nitrite reductase/ring-hydroxylating ferredoxin subunit
MDSLWMSGRAPVPTHPFIGGQAYDDVVVGAGLTGLTTGLMLAEQGRNVVVLEAREVGALASGNTTGKVSLLQGSRLSTIREHHSRALVRAYVDANRDGQQWLLEFCARAGVAVQTRTAYSYAQTPEGADTIEAEYRAAGEAGLDVTLVEQTDAPFPFEVGVALDGQAQFDPMDVLEALARALVAAGGVIHTGVRVTGVTASSPARVSTTAGPVRGSTVVLATATPILDRGLYFAKTHGLRSYCLAFDVPERSLGSYGADGGPGDAPSGGGGTDLPEGMYISVDGQTKSVRTAPRAGRTVLIVGGNGHPVGRVASEAALVADLESWTLTHFPRAVRTHTWAAQDYESFNLIPFVGALPRGRGRIYMATGYAKWGMTNAVWAAMRIASEIGEEASAQRREWHRVIGTRLTKPADIGRGAVGGVEVGREMLTGWLGAERMRTPIPRPAEGEGFVVNSGGHPVGISTVAGVTCAVRAVCPHLGGVLAWNDAEQSWDCPLHASRFAADGTRLEGPAVRDLEQLPRRGHHKH